jgi:hypothetical protein
VAPKEFDACPGELNLPAYTLVIAIRQKIVGTTENQGFQRLFSL